MVLNSPPRKVRQYLARLEIKSLFIEPGSSWENGYIESFSGKMRDELLNGEILYSLKVAQILIEMWRRRYNTIRPHSSLVIAHQCPLPSWFNLHKPSRLDYHYDWYIFWGQVKLVPSVLVHLESRLTPPFSKTHHPYLHPKLLLSRTLLVLNLDHFSGIRSMDETKMFPIIWRG